MIRSMTNIIIGIGATAVVFGTVYGIVKYSQKRDAKVFNETNAEITDKVENLYGEVIGIAFDKNSGMSKITVKDNKGKIRHGFSTVSVNQLNTLYSGKGYVQIPVISERHVKVGAQGHAFEMKD